MSKIIPKMQDVANLAGVSIKTVSRVLNNEPHVQKSVREKVRKAVDELGYVPSRSARSLRANRSYTISFVCDKGENAYLNAAQFGAVLACQSHGYGLQILMPPPLEGRPISEMIDIFQKLWAPHKPDGILLVAPIANDPTVNAALKTLGIPVARVGPVNIDVSGVVVQIDDFAAAKNAIMHLLELGHKRIGFIRGAEVQSATHERFDGYCAALREIGIDIVPELVQPGDFDFKSGVLATETLMSLKRPPTAIFASNDDMAAGVVLAATKRGLTLPRDLSVVGFDDTQIAELLLPGLTTVRQPVRELGEKAVSSLIKMLSTKDEPPKDPIIFSHELIVRSSTAKPPSSKKNSQVANKSEIGHI